MTSLPRIAFVWVLAAFLAPRGVVAQPVPVAHYTFDDGTANDSSGNGLNGVLIGGAQIVGDSTRPFAPTNNQVLLLSGQPSATGTNQTYVNILDPAGKLNFAGGSATVAAWVYMNVAKNHNAIFSQGEWRRGASVTIKGDTVPPNELWVGRTSPNEGYNSVGAVPVQQWTHVAVTFYALDDGETDITFYTNGVATGSYTMTGTMLSPVNGSAIGREWRDSIPTDCRWVFNGMIDDLQIFNTALSDADIYTLYSGTNAPPPAPTNVPPTVALVNPPNGFVVRKLTQAEVIFSKPVQGVDAGDLLVAGAPATNLTAVSASRYIFTFPQPAAGVVLFNWTTNAGIADLTNASNPFAGGGWTVTLNPLQPQAGVVLNELNYDPDPKTEHVEFIELYNDSEQTNDLSGWRFTSGITYTFPPNTLLPPDSYLVITEDKAAFDAKFGDPSQLYPVTAFDQWTSGNLSNDGERVRLVNAASQIVSEVTYGVQFPWPIGADGDGPAMERINPWVNGDLPGSWRSSDGGPTPGRANSVFAANAPPDIGSVTNTPAQPLAGQNITVAAQIQDPDGVGAVTLQYQVVSPGNYISAYLARPTGVLLARPDDPLQPNPVYQTNWISIPMNDSGTNGDAVAGDSIYTAVIPGNTNRTLVRYRIIATDMLGASVQVPYADDPALNFACFIYNGVPDYTAGTLSISGAPHTYPASLMTSVPVYHLITSSNDFMQCLGYNSADRIPVANYDAREAYNWTGTFVYDGVVYDNIGYRLGRRNSRYAGYVSGSTGPIGKRSFKFKFNHGHLAWLRDMDGSLYSQPTETLISHNMVGSRSNPDWGLDQTANNLMWNLVGVPAANTHWFELRVIQGVDEAPTGANGQYLGDYYGLELGFEDYDSHFIDERGLEKGNIYKLVSNITNGLVTQKYQARDAVTNAEDFSNIIFNLRPERSDDWLNEYVNYDEYYHYKAVAEAVRHYDVQPNLAEHLKNREYYFEPSATNSLGWLWILPQDSDTTWGPNFNGGVDFKKQAIYGYGGTNARPNFIRDYKNVVREVRDLLWTPEQISLVLDPLVTRIGPLVPVDQDRWINSPAVTGSQSNPPIANVVADMKKFAFTGGSWTGGNDVNIWDPNAKDSGISGLQGRGAYMDSLAADPLIPNTPVVAATGPTNFPVNYLIFSASPYSGTNAFAAWQWRIAEVTLTNELPLPSGVHPKFEITSSWESGELTDANNREIYIPSTAVQPGHNYRVRVRTKDASGRWSHWSAPVQLTASVAAAQAWPLQSGPYVLTNWDVASAAGTYPPDMLFYQVTNSLGDPGLSVEMDSLWTLPYNLTSRSRINGLGADGFSFINTSNPQTNSGAGYVGAAVLALNTLGKDNLRVTWTGGTVVPNDRVYAIRLQYRVGGSGAFSDVLDTHGNPVEYVRNSLTGHSAVLGPVTLPAAANNQSYVQLRWKYYYVSGNNNARAQLRVGNIQVIAVDRPVLGSAVTQNGSGLNFNSTSQAGLSYQLEYQNDLNDPAWTPLGLPAAGTGGIMTFTNDITTQPQRFYRVVVVSP